MTDRKDITGLVVHTLVDNGLDLVWMVEIEVSKVNPRTTMKTYSSNTVDKSF